MNPPACMEGEDKKSGLYFLREGFHPEFNCAQRNTAFGKDKKVLLTWPVDGMLDETACLQRQSLAKCCFGATSLYLVEGKRAKRCYLLTNLPRENGLFNPWSTYFVREGWEDLSPAVLCLWLMRKCPFTWRDHKSVESPATLAPSYPLGTGPGHCGIRSTISVTFPISQLEAGSLLDLTPSLIFGGDLMLFYISQNIHIQRRG